MQRRTFLKALSVTALCSTLSAQPIFAQGKNALLEIWTGPYGGVPAFDTYSPEMFGAAFEASMASYRRDIARIADNPEPPTFANTLEALEESGRDYQRVSALFGVYTSTMNTQQVQALDREWRPRFAALHDEVIQNGKLFARLKAVYEGDLGKSPEQKRLAWVYYNQFTHSGAQLKAAEKTRMSAINQRLAQLYTQFSQNVLADEEGEFLKLKGKEDLAGLPPSLVEAARASAQERGLGADEAVISNTRSAMEPFLSYSSRRDLREKGWRMWTRRGDTGGKTDNNAIVSEILKLRAEKARLLGHKTFAHWRLENTMARTPEKAMDLMVEVWKPAVERVRQEVADMQALVDGEGGKFKIQPWDYRYYAEKVRKAKYDLDESEIKPYLQLDKLRDGMFWMAQRLYGFTFERVQGLATIHPDVEIYEVKGQQGGHVGLFYFDPYARTGKSSGAWMSEYRTQEAFRKPVTPIVSNNSNFIKGSPGKPVLLSFDDADTLFHEFGHALHGLISQVQYPMLAGTNVPRDYVEFPSQLHENWLTTPELLNRFALHHQSGQPMPAALVEKIKKASTFNQGFSTVEFLASALVDMRLHLLENPEVDPKVFEKELLTELGMPAEIIMRHRIPHFNHLFADDGYSAGYYSYLWSDVLNHDAYEAFEESGDVFHPQIARRLREHVMQVGNTLDPAEGYRKFRGRDPQIAGLLKARGFPVPRAVSPK